MPDCGVTEFARGGMLAEVHMTASAVTESRVSASELTSCELVKTAAVDEESAAVIANAVAKLPQGMLMELAKAIIAAVPKSDPVDGPMISTEASLPSAVAGSREALLGKPENWLEYQGYVVPVYKEGK